VVVWARRASKKIGIPYLFLQPLKPATSNLIRNLGLGVRYRKTMFRTKIGGVWARGASKKIGTPYLFLQPLKPSSLVHNLGLGVAYQKLTLSTKIGMVLARGAFTKFWTLTFLQPLKLATSNLVHNLVWGVAYQIQRLGHNFGLGSRLPKHLYYQTWQWLFCLPSASVSSVFMVLYRYFFAYILLFIF